MELAQIIGVFLNMPPSKVEYLLKMTKPQVQISGNTNKVVAGRFDLKIYEEFPAYKRYIT